GGRPEGANGLTAAMALHPLLRRSRDRDELLLDFVNDITGGLYFAGVLTDGRIHDRGSEALEGLERRLRTRGAVGATLGVFAGVLARPGHVVVTTYHSSKGRQFNAVVLPFLQEGFMPKGEKNFTTNTWRLAPEKTPDRLLFYVGFTRARH